MTSVAAASTIESGVEMVQDSAVTVAKVGVNALQSVVPGAIGIGKGYFLIFSLVKSEKIYVFVIFLSLIYVFIFTLFMCSQWSHVCCGRCNAA